MQKIDTSPVTEQEWTHLQPHLSDWSRLLFTLMWETGLRLSEALGAERADVDPKTGAVKAQRGKGGSFDTVLVPRPLAQRLVDYYRPSHKRDHRIFGGYSARSAEKALQRACERAGIRHLHPHQFRHSFAYQYARRPLNVPALEHQIRLQRLLGHKDPRSTAIYFQPGEHEVLDFWRELRAGDEAEEEQRTESKPPEPPTKPEEPPWKAELRRAMGLD